MFEIITNLFKKEEVKPQPFITEDGREIYEVKYYVRGSRICVFGNSSAEFIVLGRSEKDHDAIEVYDVNYDKVRVFADGVLVQAAPAIPSLFTEIN